MSKTYKMSLWPWGFPTRELYFSAGNAKVRCPIFNVGSATHCAQRRNCPYDRLNYKRRGKPWCYAQKTENLYSTVLRCRDRNAEALGALHRGTIVKNNHLVAFELADRIAKVCVKMGRPYVRFNESGDLAVWNVKFLGYVAARLNWHRIKSWTYSKAPLELRQRLRYSGCRVLRSDIDFVCVDTAAEAKALGLPLCPGGCGDTCTRCVEGKQTAIIRH